MKSFLERFTYFKQGSKLSASEMNDLTALLASVGHLKVVPLLAMRRTSTGIEIFLSGGDQKRNIGLLCLITAVVVNGDPVTQTGQRDPAPNENIRYTVRPLQVPTNIAIPANTVYLPVYGRPTKQDGIVIWPAKVNDLCMLYIRPDGLVELQVFSETLKMRDCPPAPAPIQPLLQNPEKPTMQGFNQSLEFQLDLNVVNSVSEWFDIRLFDVVSLSAVVQDSSGGAWGGTITVQWSPDLRVAKDATSSTINADGVVTPDLSTVAAGWVRAKVTSAYGGGSRKVAIKWSAKTSRGGAGLVNPITNPSKGFLTQTSGIAVGGGTGESPSSEGSGSGSFS
jgi:hypothetical protein